MSQFVLTTVQKLVPGLRKEGYTEASTDSSTNVGSSQPRPEAPAPARPRPDEPPYSPDRMSPRFDPRPMNPLEIGRRDLDPFPSNPFAPPSLFPSGGDGMFVGPNHPIFGAGMRGQSPGGRGRWGGDGFLPPMGAPPGARFDPVGPDLGSFPGGSFPGPGQPLRGPPGGRNLRGPDNDEFMPPGSSDMFS